LQTLLWQPSRLLLLLAGAIYGLLEPPLSRERPLSSRAAASQTAAKATSKAAVTAFDVGVVAED